MTVATVAVSLTGVLGVPTLTASSTISAFDSSLVPAMTALEAESVHGALRRVVAAKPLQTTKIVDLGVVVHE